MQDLLFLAMKCAVRALEENDEEEDLCTAHERNRMVRIRIYNVLSQSAPSITSDLNAQC